MCGIVGVLFFEEDYPGRKAVLRMAKTITHRGPDGEGFFFDYGDGIEWTDFQGKCQNRHALGQGKRSPWVVFGHRRLAVLDLSERGHQPMTNEDGSIWIIHNGEVFNYLEIRKELEVMNHQFNSMTDTEVIIHAYEEWGTECIGHFNGMWAFCIWDSKKRQLFCARDRAGVKPFYYTFNGKRFAFASEIKALLTLEDLDVTPNKQIIADYLFLGLIDHTRETFFRNIYQLRPGEHLLFEGNRLTTRSYWDIETKEIRFSKDSDYVERFYELLQDSVRLRLRSDVPIGSCLSGGLDSSSIVCLANKLMFDGQTIDPGLVGEKQKTFSSCFEELAYDERKFIEFVIDRTRAEKNYTFPQAKNLFQDLTKLIWHQDEPFGSTSIYAQWNVMRLAKGRGVTVLLDGQGGDELLAGYIPSFYHLFGQMLKRADLGRLMEEVKGFRKNHQNTTSQFMSGMLAALTPRWSKLWIQRFVKRGIEWSEEGFRRRYLRFFPGPDRFEDDLNNYLYQGFRYTSLPGLLHYEDRNSMAFSLETRLPFLDYRLVEYIFSLPSEQKIRDGVTKVILRDATKAILPEEIRNRMDKMGFVTPEDIWFRSILRNQIYKIITSRSFAERGYFDVGKVEKAFNDHCQGKMNISFTIWRWVNLELWLRVFIDRKDDIGYEGHDN
jgi:asparagine synthase (glutamine-hydrolysing)